MHARDRESSATVQVTHAYIYIILFPVRFYCTLAFALGDIGVYIHYVSMLPLGIPILKYLNLLVFETFDNTDKELFGFFPLNFRAKAQNKVV